MDLGAQPLANSYLAAGGSAKGGGVPPALRLRLRQVLPGAAPGGVRAAGGHLHRLRLLLVLLRELAAPRRGLRCDMVERFGLGAGHAGRSRSRATTATCCTSSSSEEFRVLGIEPAANVAAAAEAAGMPTLVTFFGEATARELAGRRHPGRPAARQQRAGPRAGPERLRRRASDPAGPTGVLTMEFPHLLRLIEEQPVRHHLPRALLLLLAAPRCDGSSPPTA